MREEDIFEFMLNQDSYTSGEFRGYGYYVSPILDCFSCVTEIAHLDVTLNCVQYLEAVFPIDFISNIPENVTRILVRPIYDPVRTIVNHRTVTEQYRDNTIEVVLTRDTHESTYQVWDRQKGLDMGTFMFHDDEPYQEDILCTKALMDGFIEWWYG